MPWHVQGRVRAYLITGLSCACQFFVTIWYGKRNLQFVICTYFVILACDEDISFDFLNFCDGKISFPQLAGGRLQSLPLSPN